MLSPQLTLDERGKRHSVRLNTRVLHFVEEMHSLLNVVGPDA
jgi:hypothetical protein